MRLLDVIRFGLAGLLVYVAFYGTPKGVELPQPYTGDLKNVNEAASQMAAEDRQGLSEALLAASKMLASDKANLVKTTEDLQRFVRGTVAYGYTSFALSKYPTVSAEVQKELEKTVGPTVQAVTSDLRDKTVATLIELSKAVK